MKSRKTKTKENTCNPTDEYTAEFAEKDTKKAIQSNEKSPDSLSKDIESAAKKLGRAMKDNDPGLQSAKFNDLLFNVFNAEAFEPQDFQTEVSINSLESRVGYSTLIRQMHEDFSHLVKYYRSKRGGSLTREEAREKAFQACENEEEAKKLFHKLRGYPLDVLDFNNLGELRSFAPRVAERLWEDIKKEGRAEFESGHAAANRLHPTNYLRTAWNVARYLGVRESFIDEWKPKGGIEVALIDMLAQSYFQWQYWLEQSVLRAQTEPRSEHHEYSEWKRGKEESQRYESWRDGYWFPPYVSEQEAVQSAVQTADRWNRIFMRTLRQLRDLRRYSPVTINNPNQVNIATDGGQQVNVAKPENEDKAGKITS